MVPVAAAKYAACVAAAALLYLALTDPKKVVVDEDGTILGTANVLREGIQGRAFWSTQLQLARQELERLRRRAEYDADPVNGLPRLQADLQRTQEELYQQQPHLRPTAATAKAQSLRDAADRVEAEQLASEVHAVRLARARSLKSIMEMVEGRLGK